MGCIRLLNRIAMFPILEILPNGGFAWASEGAHEVIRQWGNLFSMAAMMSLPWALISLSKTPIIYGIVWDVLLALHIIYLLVPKDMQLLPPTYSLMDKGMNGLNCDWQKNNQNAVIMLLRKGWGCLVHCHLAEVTMI